MMYRSQVTNAPVITFLSGSVAASRRTQELFRAALGMTEVPVAAANNNNNNDLLPQLTFGTCQWHSHASRCANSGIILHTLSPHSQYHATSRVRSRDDDTSLSLLSISDGRPRDDDDGSAGAAAVRDARRVLASRIDGVATGKACLRSFLGWPVTAFDVLRDHRPILHVPSDVDVDSDDDGTSIGGSSTVDDRDANVPPYTLREIVIPHYSNQRLSQLCSRVGLHRANCPRTKRPVVGLYQWPRRVVGTEPGPSSLFLRPLPAAAQDRTLPPPSLIFHTKDTSLDDAARRLTLAGIATAKIGFNGSAGSGQLRLVHPALSHIDLRLCDGDGLSASFAEAHESLLAGTLGEIQSAHVLADGSETKREQDELIGVGDCWAEFRATVKRPSGYWRRGEGAGGKGGPDVAKAPPSPYQ